MLGALFSSIAFAQDDCTTARVPNPNPLAQETTEFYGLCFDGKALNGIVLWKQAGQPYGISCLINGVEKEDHVKNSIEYYEKSACMRHLKTIPNYCTSGDWAGQCKDGKPHGVGIKAWYREGLPRTYYTYIGQAENGQPNGYGMLHTSPDNVADEIAWWVNGEKLLTCNGGPLGCKAVLAARSQYSQAERLEKDIKCEEALKADRAAQSADTQSHSDDDGKNGYRINYSNCTEKRKFELVMQGKDPQAMYLAASSYEADGERSRAKTIYRQIVERFSKNPIAIKAADRLTRLTDVEAVESSNRSAAYQVENAHNQSREAAYKQCMHNYNACMNGCNYKSNCTSSCAICTK